MYGRRTRTRRFGHFGQTDAELNAAAAGSGGDGGSSFWSQLGDWLFGVAKTEGGKAIDKLVSGSGGAGTAAAPGPPAPPASGPLVVRSQAGNVSTVDLMNYRPITARSATPVATTPTSTGLPWWGWGVVGLGVVVVALRSRR